MDFARFVDLLVSKSLWLCRVDRLDDPREGLLTDSEFVQLSKQSQPVATIEGLRSLSYVNCWCQSESESMAMWDLYGAGACGVSIKTTVGALRVAIAGTAIPIHISRVKYRDWKCYQGDIENLIGLCVRKSDSYRHESEVRLLFWEPSTEPLSVAGERAGQGAPIEVERLAREIMARLAGFFPSVDFTTVHGASFGSTGMGAVPRACAAPELAGGSTSSGRPTHFNRRDRGNTQGAALGIRTRTQCC
jgi:hypothetical protein